MTSLSQDPDGRLWCSTAVNSERVHIGGKGFWGHCNMVDGYCKSRPNKEKILLAIVNTVQEQQNNGLEAQRDSNAILKSVVEKLN